MLMFFLFEGKLISQFKWWGVLAFFVTFFFVFVFLRRMNFPRWVHPVHFFVPPEVLQNSEVNKSVILTREYSRVAISAVVGGYMGVQVWLSPLVASQPLWIHSDQVHVVIQLQRVCLLLGDKFHHSPPSFGESLRGGLYNLGYEFEQLKDEYSSLFQEVTLLEGPSPTSWFEVVFLGVVLSLLGILVVVFVRGPRRGVLILVIPAVGQVPLVFWVRLFFPVLLVFVAILILWGWRRSGKDFNLFLWEFFFPGEVDPPRVAQFFHRLKWFLLATGLAPLVWLGCDLWWVYLNSLSYLFPELNLEGLKGVPPRLDQLCERICKLDVSLEVQESLLQRSQILSDRYNYLVQHLLAAEQLICPHYPGGMIVDPATNLTPLLRRVVPGVGLIVVLVLLFTRRKGLPPREGISCFPVLFVSGENIPPGGFFFFVVFCLSIRLLDSNLPFLSRRVTQVRSFLGVHPRTLQGTPFVFFFFNGGGFLEEKSFFFYSFVFFFLLIGLIFKLKGSPPGWDHFFKSCYPC